MSRAVSVIIPSQAGPWLERAVASALAQTDVDLEVLVVLNGTRRAVEFRDARVRVLVSDADDGANGARQLGILEAQNDVIALLDDDDEWLPGKLAVQLSELRALAEEWPEVDWIVSCRLREERSSGTSEVFPKGSGGVVRNVEEYLFSRRTFRSERPHLQTSSLLFPRSLAVATPFESAQRYHQDWTWLIRAFQAGAHAYMCSEPLSVRHVQGTDSVGGRITWQQSLQWAGELLVEPRVRADFAMTMATAKASRRHDVRGVFACFRWGLRQGVPGLPASAIWVREAARATFHRVSKGTA